MDGVFKGARHVIRRPEEGFISHRTPMASLAVPASSADVPWDGHRNAQAASAPRFVRRVRGKMLPAMGNSSSPLSGVACQARATRLRDPYGFLRAPCVARLNVAGRPVSTDVCGRAGTANSEVATSITLVLCSTAASQGPVGPWHTLRRRAHDRSTARGTVVPPGLLKLLGARSGWAARARRFGALGA